MSRTTPFEGVQEATHNKGRVVTRLAPPPCPMSWAGSFRRQLPLVATSVHASMTPETDACGHVGGWRPALEVAPAPQVATLQYTIGNPKMGSTSVVRTLLQQLALGTPVPMPPPDLGCLELLPPPLCLCVTLDGGGSTSADAADDVV